MTMPRRDNNTDQRDNDDDDRHDNDTTTTTDSDWHKVQKRIGRKTICPRACARQSNNTLRSVNFIASGSRFFRINNMFGWFVRSARPVFLFSVVCLVEPSFRRPVRSVGSVGWAARSVDTVSRFGRSRRLFWFGRFGGFGWFGRSGRSV